MSSLKHTQDDNDNTAYHNPEDPENVKTTGLRFGTRHVQCFMIFLCLTTSFCIRGHLPLTLISMTGNSTSNDAPVLPWDSGMKGIAVSSFYWGYLFLLVPAGRVAEIYGQKCPLVLAMLVCGITLLFTPSASIYGGFYGMLVSRLIQGATQAFIFPSVHVMLSKWAPIKEKGVLFACVFSGLDFGTVVIMPLTGTLAESQWGWPSVFYVTGGIAISWALLYAHVGANSPQEHKTISGDERSYILRSLPHVSHDKSNLKTPWRAILTSVPVYTLVFTHCAAVWGYYTILFQTPTFINGVLGLNMKHSGLLGALPYLSSLVATFFYGMANHWMVNKKSFSKATVTKLWNSIGFFGVGLMLTILSFAGTNVALVMGLVVTAVTLNSAERLGFVTNHLDLSPNFAGTLMGITVAVSTISTLSAPLYAGFIVTDSKSESSWRIVFLTSAVVSFVGNVIFLTFGTVEVQPWNFPPNQIKGDQEGAESKDKLLRENGKS